MEFSDHLPPLVLIGLQVTARFLRRAAPCGDSSQFKKIAPFCRKGVPQLVRVAAEGAPMRASSAPHTGADSAD